MEEIDSAMVCGMAERLAEGKLSVRTVSKFGNALAADGCQKARWRFSVRLVFFYYNQRAKWLPLPQVSSKQIISGREQDFFRWLKLPLTIYKTQVPVKTDASKNSRLDGRGVADISMVLPSDHLQALHDAGLEVFCQTWFLCLTD